LCSHTLYRTCCCRWIYIQLAVAMYIVWVTPVRVVSAGVQELMHLSSMQQYGPHLAHMLC
jgi:hypothetical protein